MAVAHGAKGRRGAMWCAVLVVAAGALAGGCAGRNWQPDVVQQVARYGIDYGRTLTASARDDAALRRLFLLSLVVDAAGAEAYGDGLLRALADIGERRFVHVLTSCGATVRGQVLDVLCYQTGFDYQDVDLKTWSGFKRAYPDLASAIAARAGR